MAVVSDAGTGLRAPARGATLVQLRAPGAPVRRIEADARRLAAQCGVPVLVSSRCDVVLATGCAGVHLPEADIGVAEARRLLGPERTVGNSVHSLAAALAAEAGGADLLVFGPVFATASHPEREPAGLAALAEVAAAVRIPVLAIGGVSAAGWEACARAGAAGYAAITEFAGDAR